MAQEKKGNKENVTWYIESAEHGDAEAQYSLGLYYYHGNGVSQDYKEAAKWFSKAAEQGNEWALWRLKECCKKVPELEELVRRLCEGSAIQENNKMENFRIAAEHGDADAQYKLGFCYYHGNGVPKNYKEAVKWFGKSAEQGNEWAMWRLRECCEKIVERGDADAQLYLEMFNKTEESFLKKKKESSKSDFDLEDFIHKYGHGIWKIGKSILENI